MKIKEIIFLIAITLIAFSTCLSGGFIGDDEVLLVSNTFYKDAGNIPSLFTKDYLTKSDELYLHPKSNLGSGSVAYRPVLSSTFFLDYSIWQLNPYGYHLTNVLLHILNVILVFFLALLLISDKNIAFLSSLLFCLHPTKVEAVASIGYRADVLSSFFVLSSMCFFLKYRKTPGCFCHGAKKLSQLFLSLICYFLALFTKEAAIVLPGILFVYDCYFDGKKVGIIKRMLSPIYYGYIAVACFYLFIYLKVFPNTTLSDAKLIGGSLLSHVSVIFWIFALYMKDIVLPFLVKMLPPLYAPNVDQYFVLKGLVGVAILLGLIIAIIKMNRSNKETSFAVLFFLICLIPVSNIIPIANPMAHRFLYLPSVGIFIAIAILLNKLCFKIRKIKRVASAGIMIKVFVVCICFIMTLSMCGTWRSNYSIADSLIKDHPDNLIGYSILGEFNFKSGRYVEARQAFQKAVSLGSTDPKDFYMLAMSSLDNFDEAQRYFLAAMSNNDEYVAPLVGLGRMYFLNKDYDKARVFLRKAVEVTPAYASCGYLIQIYMSQGKTADAYKVLEKAENFPVEKEELVSLKKMINEIGQHHEPIDIGI
ncbi:MAG: tetratricopeptide repeat protein [Candidatus Omnitrophica bacterium]|nr:tetratricopeptide repeat protein [Candidatus Omnitrophota bacterium]MBU1995611.1 tetratricopeptide repeat protein [Candidatus Omnitrophota bacterium]MBU4333014.1 tetratricopeptide repeat protein [Candidatus Omnitrophota bacterium]